MSDYYFLNYNKRLDCFWIDYRFLDGADKSQYVCTPTVDYCPIKHIAPMYDGKPRTIYLVLGISYYSKQEIRRLDDWVYSFKPPNFVLAEMIDYSFLEELTDAG